MLRSGVLLTTGALLVLGCAGSGPRIETGPDAVTTPDGLYRVEGVPVGALFMKPDYRFGSYDQFVLGDTQVSFEQGARVLEPEELARLIAIFEAVARETIAGTGRREVRRAGPCVAFVGLALVDLALEEGRGATSLGAFTLVLEIRDGHTLEPLLRYGQRRRLAGPSLSGAFDRFATRFQRDFRRALPEPDAATRVLTCQQRAAEDA